MSSSRENNRLRRLLKRRNAQRDRYIRAMGSEIDRWTRRLTERTLGIVAAGRGGYSGVSGSLDVLFIGAIGEGAAILERGLRRLWAWSWDTATRAQVEAVPMGIWVRRLMPVKSMTGTEATLEYADNLDDENEIQRILDGEADREEAIEIVRRIEFPQPSPERVDQILSDTNARDGLSAMQRIKTVGGNDLGELKRRIMTAYSGQLTGASAIDALAPTIRQLVGNDPGQSTGMNYRAKRIARTEGMRIAEAGLRESWESVQDLLKGIRTFTSGDENVRDSHRKWHDKLYYRTGRGEYRATDGELLPDFPAGPNCRCWTTPELADDLTAGLPPDVPFHKPEPPEWERDKPVKKKAKKAKAKKPEFALDIRDGVSGRFAKKCRKVLQQDIPNHVRQIVEQERGVRVTVGERLTKVRPDLKGKKPRGWFGGTWDRAMGLYSPADKEIIITEKVIRGSRLVEAFDVDLKHTLRHEYGHAVDDNLTPGLSSISESPEFVKAWKADINDMLVDTGSSVTRTGVRFQGDASRLTYFMQVSRGVPTDSGAKETFAEAFATIHGGGATDSVIFKTRFSRTHAIVKAIIGGTK